MKHSETKKAFDTIVDFNHFHRDVLVPVIAAEDTIVRATLSFLDSSSMPDKSKTEVQDILMDLERHVVHTYELPAELSDMVFKQCRDMIWLGDFERE